MLGYLGRHPEYQIEHARWQAGLDEAAHKFDAASRRLLGRFDDDRATCRERAADLAGRGESGKIPRGESGHDPDRLLHHQLAYALAAPRNDAAIGAPSLLGKPL